MKVLRNPNRKLHGGGKVPYVPEWVKLGVEPTQVYENTNKDFQMSPNSKKKRLQQQAHAPKQTRVNVGHGETWFSREDDPKLTAPILPEEVPEPPPVYSQDLEPYKEEDEDLSVEEEEDDLEDSSDEEADDEEEESGAEEAPNNQLKERDYALIVKGKIVFVTQQLPKMERVIEEITYNGLNGEDIKFEDISLIKRIPLKIGILATE